MWTKLLSSQHTRETYTLRKEEANIGFQRDCQITILRWKLARRCFFRDELASRASGAPGSCPAIIPNVRVQYSVDQYCLFGQLWRIRFLLCTVRYNGWSWLACVSSWYRPDEFSTASIVTIRRTNPQEIIAAITGRKSKHKGSAEIKEVS